MSAAPLVVDGVAYYVTWSGAFVALDYSSCRELWQTNVSHIVLSYQPLNPIALSAKVPPVSRTTPVMERNILFIGTQANALLLAIDKRDGNLIDLVQISKHPVAIITQSLTVWRGTVFVGSSSQEEDAAAVVPGYVCCSFIGSMNALTLENESFTLLWSQNMVPPDSNFTGAAIWGPQPAIDPTQNQVFIATGNVYSTPPGYAACLNKTTNSSISLQGNVTDPCVPQNVYQESVVAFDAATGRINWAHELTPLDAWNIACVMTKINPLNCPPSPGQDADFGMAPSFVPASKSTPFGKDTLVVGQKNGNLYAISAQTGKLFWATATSPDGDGGGLIWGIAVGKPVSVSICLFTLVFAVAGQYRQCMSQKLTTIPTQQPCLGLSMLSWKGNAKIVLTRHECRLLYRVQFRTDALAASERDFTLKQRIRRLESDKWEDTMGDASPCQ